MKIETWYHCTSGNGITLKDCTEDELKTYLLSKVEDMYDYLITHKNQKDIIDLHIIESIWDYNSEEEIDYDNIPSYNKDEVVKYLTKFINEKSIDDYEFSEWQLWSMFDTEELYFDHCDQCGDYNWAKEYDLNVY